MWHTVEEAVVGAEVEAGVDHSIMVVAQRSSEKEDASSANKKAISSVTAQI